MARAARHRALAAVGADQASAHALGARRWPAGVEQRGAHAHRARAADRGRDELTRGRRLRRAPRTRNVTPWACAHEARLRPHLISAQSVVASVTQPERYTGVRHDADRGLPQRDDTGYGRAHERSRRCLIGGRRASRASRTRRRRRRARDSSSCRAASSSQRAREVGDVACSRAKAARFGRKGARGGSSARASATEARCARAASAVTRASTSAEIARTKCRARFIGARARSEACPRRSSLAITPAGARPRSTVASRGWRRAPTGSGTAAPSGRAARRRAARLRPAAGRRAGGGQVGQTGFGQAVLGAPVALRPEGGMSLGCAFAIWLRARRARRTSKRSVPGTGLPPSGGGSRVRGVRVARGVIVPRMRVGGGFRAAEGGERHGEREGATVERSSGGLPKSRRARQSAVAGMRKVPPSSAVRGRTAKHTGAWGQRDAALAELEGERTEAKAARQQVRRVPAWDVQDVARCVFGRRARDAARTRAQGGRSERNDRQRQHGAVEPQRTTAQSPPLVVRGALGRSPGDSTGLRTRASPPGRAGTEEQERGRDGAWGRVWHARRHPATHS